MSNNNLHWSLVAAAGMVLVAVAAVLSWRVFTRLPYRWFFVGAVLWLLAFAVKQAIMPLDAVIFPWLVRLVPPLVLVGSLYVGLQCALLEIGLTWLAVLMRPQLGRDADRAIGIGIGAGAFEACFLAAFAAAPLIGALAGRENSDSIRAQADGVAQSSTLFWLIPSVERVIAILGHAATRALVLLGTTHRRPRMIFWGFPIFALGNAMVTAVHLLGIVDKYSMWWLELAYLPMALVSIPVLKWCYARWGRSGPPALPNQFDVVSVN